LKLQCSSRYSAVVPDIGAGIGLFLLSLAIQYFNINHDLYVDELYHLLAAHSVISDGTLGIADGQYVRAEFYTRFLAFIFEIFGENIEVARASSAVTSSIFIVLVFFSIRWMVGFKEALVTTLVLCVLPSTIYLAQFIRFYAAHQLAFWAGVVGVYVLVTVRLSTSSFIAVASLVGIFFSVALYLQISTLIGLVAVISWVFLYLSNRHLNREKSSKLETYTLMLLALCGLIVVFALFTTDKGAFLLSDFRHAAPSNVENKDNQPA